MKFYIWLYRLISVVLLPLFALLLLWRIYQKKEDKNRIKERFGIADLKIWRRFILEGNDQVRIWIHAVSIGEANSAWILASELLAYSPKIKIIFTTTTLTSGAIIAKKINDLNQQYHELRLNRVIHQFLPLDSFFCIEKFLGLWRPRACLLIESEIWPNLIFSTRNKGILTFLVNARISAKSGRNWLFAKKIGFKIFDYFSVIFAQTIEDCSRLQKLTKNEVLNYGNLKSQAKELDFNPEKLQELKTAIGNRKIWLCASTHAGEEAILINLHRRLRLEFPDLLTIFVLRHPSRSQEVVELLSETNFTIRSQNKPLEANTEIYLVDSIGELGIFYRLADFAFIGGSLLPIGGHNPYEAAALNCAIISGKEVFNFVEIYNELVAKNAAFIGTNEEEIYQKIREFLNFPTTALQLSLKAKEHVKTSKNIAQKIIQKIDQILLLDAKTSS